jgi:3-oxoacyl-[acyl-carrier-protein] synthase II
MTIAGAAGATGAVTTMVTGWAWRTPLGASVDQVANRLLAGERALTANARFDASAYRCSLAATIGSAPARSRDARFLSVMGQHAMDVAGEALAMSACPARGERLGLFAAVGGLHLSWDDVMHAFAGQRADGAHIWEHGFRALHPFILLKYLSNNAHALIAAKVGARGEGMTSGGANAGAQALVSAAAALQARTIDAALVVAYDSLVHPETLVEMDRRGALTRAHAGQHVAAPYDGAAAGFVPGEAACAVVLARPDEGEGEPLALVSAAEGCDGHGGMPGAGTMGRVVARMARGDELAIDGAAAADAELDAAERHALARILAPELPLCATQAAFGQVGAAGALVQVIALGALLRRGALPAVAGLRAPAPGPLVPITRPISLVAARGRSALGVTAGAPGLVGAVRVEVP